MDGTLPDHVRALVDEIENDVGEGNDDALPGNGVASHSEVEDAVREILLDGAALRRGWFNADRLQALIDDHVSGRRDNATKLWALIQLELWLRTFVDGQARESLAVSVA